MKTFAVILTVMLGALSLTSKSINQISFAVHVVVEQQFSPQKLNLLSHPIATKKGDTIQLEKHTDYLRAMRDKQVVTENTKNKAWVIAFFLNKEISLEDAFALMNNYNEFEQKEIIYTENKPMERYYSIEVLTNNELSLQDYIKLCPELELQIEQQDENLFLMGKINSHSVAISMHYRLLAAGLKNTAIVAYEGNKQVPVYIVAYNE